MIFLTFRSAGAATSLSTVASAIEAVSPPSARGIVAGRVAVSAILKVVLNCL